MTALIGLLCSDGVIIGSDSSATSVAGNRMPTIESTTKKVTVIRDKIIIAGTGQVGLGQRFCHIVEQAYDQHIFAQQHHINIGAVLSEHTRKNFAATGIQGNEYGALMAFAKGSDFYLVEFAPTDFQPEFKTITSCCVSMGSGQLITDPFLGLMQQAFSPSGPPNLQDGLFMVAWALEHVIKFNPGGVNGPSQVAVLSSRSKQGHFEAKILEQAEMEEHIESSKAALRHLGDFRRTIQAQNAQAVPRPPSAA